MFEKFKTSLINKIENLWNTHKEEIAEQVEKKLGFTKPIKLYSQLDSLYYIFDGLWQIHNHWNEEKFELRKHGSQEYGFYPKGIEEYLLLELFDTHDYVRNNGYSFTFYKDTWCKFYGVVRAAKVDKLEIHEKEYDAQHIINIFDSYLSILEPYKKQVDEYYSQEKAKELYNNYQARELERI